MQSVTDVAGRSSGILRHVGGVHYSWCDIVSPTIAETYFYSQRDCEHV